MDLKYGYLKEADASLIDSVEVKNGQVIHSEDHGVQFIDYENKRHVHGSVLPGVYNDDGYIDFSEMYPSDILDAITENGFIKDGQVIKTNETIYQYRKIENKNLIVKMNEDYITTEKSQISYVIYLPEYADGNLVNIDVLVSIDNTTNGKKLFLVKIVDNVLDLTACEDMDGTFDSTTFDISVAHDTTNKLFTISTNIASKLKVISYSVSSSGSSKHEGLYVVSSDI